MKRGRTRMLEVRRAASAGVRGAFNFRSPAFPLPHPSGAPIAVC